MQDNRVKIEDQCVVDLAQTEGWEILRKHLEQNISSLTTKLVETKFTSLAEVADAQAEIRGLSKAITFVDTRVKRTIKE